MPSPAPDRPRLAFIGGTGPEGRGLALRMAAAGYPVTVGSRSRERAQNAAREMAAALPGATLSGDDNASAAANADIIFLTIPYSGVGDTLPNLAEPARGKIVVSTIAPLEFREGRPVALRPDAGSAAQEVQAGLHEARVVSAFQTVDAERLRDLAAPLDTDVIVCSDHQDARHTVMEMAGELPGVRALSGGRLAASRYVEECTALLITINRIYKAHSGLRITGVKR